jgi:hypothetical protein
MEPRASFRVDQVRNSKKTQEARLCSQMFLKSSLQMVSKMRTKQQQRQEMTMLNDIMTILTNSRATLLEDSLGLIALFTMLLVGLHLSGAA